MTPVAAVLASTRFHDALTEIRTAGLLNEFPAISAVSAPKPIDWDFALLCASALTSSKAEAAQDIVLRVSTGCLGNQGTQPMQRAAAAALLERIGNRRTVQLAESRDLVAVEAWTDMPPRLRMEVIRRRIELTVSRRGDADLSVNEFQSAFWNAASAHKWVSVSAPTSAGKSRIIREWFSERIAEEPTFTAVYIVPTRALVEEVAKDFRKLKITDTGVHTLPWDSSIGAFKKEVYVLTQERLHLVQQTRPTFKMDLLFVDEAQNLGEASRGVLLQQVIDHASYKNPNIQVLFASPLSSNPELLLEGAPKGATTMSFASESVTVNQNLVHVTSVRNRPKLREVWLVQDGNPRRVGSITLPNNASHVPKRLAFVANALGGDRGGNIVYVNGAGDAEKVAQSLYESGSPLGDEQQKSDLADLSELVKSSVHPKYLLALYLERGVAFHYGNMPLAIRVEVERLFETGAIRYLVCTSTLLEGVNLACRNIFMRNPQKGKGNPISIADFWNLAGRAGRWGQEFQGNIVCVDTDDNSLWPDLPLTRTRAPLTRSVDKAMTDCAALNAFILGGNPSADSDHRAESTFSYLCTRYLGGADIDQLLSPVGSVVQREQLRGLIIDSVVSISFPAHLIERHSGISPRAMERLYQRFEQSDQSILELALPVPEEKDARAQYKDALALISETLTTAFGGEKRQWQLANLIVNWMHGMPLARLIDQRLNNTSDSTPAVIRGVMADVESVARFLAPKYLACYLDLLNAYAAASGYEEALPVEDVVMMLELGVSRTTEVSLMAMGISRNATIAISEYIVEDNLTPQEVQIWLARQDIAHTSLPRLVKTELLMRLAESESAGDFTAPSD